MSENDCECFYYSMDSVTPLNVTLSAFYKRSFAFYTVKERLPVILTKTIDILVRNKDNIVAQYGKESREDLKLIIGELSKLKYEIQTNKPMQKLEGNGKEIEIWNRYLEERTQEDGHPTFFNTIWLYAECYMYRRMRKAIESTITMQNFDPFIFQKEDAFTNSVNAMIPLAKYLTPVVSKPAEYEMRQEFINLMKLNLWGNKCDLSLSLGADSAQTTDPLATIDEFDKFILSDDTEEIWKLLSNDTGPATIDLVLDNSGYELFTDLCVVDFLCSNKLVDKVRIHGKAMPWFVSDVLQHDFEWTLQQLMNHDNPYLKFVGNRWNNYFVRTKRWSFEAEDYWTLPFDFSRMKTVDRELYDRLSKAKLIIFKGDLNYRKLFRETNWDPTTPTEVGVGDFKPTSVCTLRTIKADMICGLEPGVAERVNETDPQWMTNGNWGVVQLIRAIDS